jgi:hypothetical protein
MEKNILKKNLDFGFDLKSNSILNESKHLHNSILNESKHLQTLVQNVNARGHECNKYLHKTKFNIFKKLENSCLA